MRKFDAVVWDWNGTLLDDAGLCVRVINGMLSRRGLPPVTVGLYKALIEFPVIHYYRKLGFDFTDEPFEHISDEYVSAYQAGWRRETALHAGALDTLAALKAAGVGLSVLSACKSSHLAEQMEHTGVAPLFDAVSGVDNHHGHGKLHIARGHAAALGTDPARTLFVGDTAHDAEVAAEAGCACMLVSFGHYAHDRLKPLGLPIAACMSDVLDYVGVS